MKLKADIIREGTTSHLVWSATSGSASPVEPATMLEIVSADDAVFLLRLNSGGECIADTWHNDVAAAKAQATFEYGIDVSGWITAP